MFRFKHMKQQRWTSLPLTNLIGYQDGNRVIFVDIKKQKNKKTLFDKIKSEIRSLVVGQHDRNDLCHENRQALT